MRLEQRTATALALLLLVALMPNTPASFPETPASRTFATSSDGSLAGWLAAGDGQSSERIHDMVALEDGHMLMVGSFEQDINFHGDVEGFSTNDTELGAFGEDMFVAWVAENGTWTRSLSVSSGYFDGLHEVERLTDGTLVVAGRFCDLSFGESCNLTLDGWGSINKTDDNDPSALMIAAMSPDGTWLWARAFSNAFDMTVSMLKRRVPTRSISPCRIGANSCSTTRLHLPHPKLRLWRCWGWTTTARICSSTP